MSWLDGARYRLRTLLAAPRHEREVEEEMRFHLELDAMHAGDRDRARRRFGNVSYYREEVRRIGLRGWLDAVEQDLRYGWRAIMRTPAVSATIVVTLALGIGVNIALFSMIDRLLLRLPGGISNAEHVVRLYEIRRNRITGQREPGPVVNYPRYLAIRDAVGNAGDVAGYVHVGLRVGNGEGALPVNGVAADADYFTMLGVRPALGRFFARDETLRADAPHLVVISHRLWRQRFREDSTIIGRPIDIGKQRFTVIGVAPRDFTGLTVSATDVWVPFGVSINIGEPPFYMNEHTWAIWPIVRPRTGVDARQVAAAATTGLRAADNADVNGDTTAVITTGSLNGRLGPATKPQEVSIAIRLAAVAMAVLLIACANVANLLLARAVTRRREIAVRLALGVSRSRLVLLLLGESMLLALLSGVAALLVGVWAGGALRRVMMPEVSWADGILDGRLVMFAIVAALLTGILGGLAPAWRASRADVSGALKAGSRQGTLQRSRLRTALVIAQAALSVVLLVAAGLFVRSLQRVHGLDVGYDFDRLTFIAVYFDDGRSQWKRHVAEMAPQLPVITRRLAAVPGVERVGVTSLAPLWGVSFQGLLLPGGVEIPSPKSGGPSYMAVSPGTLAALGLSVLRGRDFSVDDREGGPRVMIVNETLARTVWPRDNPIGKCLHVGLPTAPCTTVVGVLENARRSQLVEEPTMQYYLPFAQVEWEHPSADLVVRVPGEHAAAVTAAARREIRSLLPGAEVTIRTMDEILGRQLQPWRMSATLFLTFGLLALLVAAVGVYSTTSYTVRQRTHEMGIRRALGARVGHMLRLVIGGELRVVAIGIVLGIGLSLALGRFVESLLYNVRPTDPVVLTAVVLTLTMIAAIACLAPAIRAARVDPAVTLRAE